MSDPKIIDIGKSPDPKEDTLRNNIFEPLSKRGFPRWLVFALGLLGLVYILSPTCGLIEFIPDNQPIVADLDEGAAVLLVFYGLLEFLGGKTKA